MSKFRFLSITVFLLLALASRSVAGHFEPTGVASASKFDEGDWYGNAVAVEMVLERGR